MKKFISLVLTTLLALAQAPAQWALLTNPYRAVAHYKASLHNWVLIQNKQQLYLTKNAGQTWQNVSAGLPQTFAMPSISIREAWMFGLEIYSGQFMRYDFSGNAWIPFGTGLPADGFKRDFIDAGIHMLLIHLDPFYSHGKIYRSTPDGLSWQVSADGLPEYFEASHLMKVDKRLLVAGYGGVFYSDDQGKTWKDGNTGVVEGCQIQYLLKNNGNLVYTFDDCYNNMISINGGASWTVANGLPANFYASGIVAVKGNMLLSGCCNFEDPYSNNFFYSKDEGKNWQPVPYPVFPNNQNAGNLVRAGDLLYAAGDRQIFRYADAGYTWQVVNEPTCSYLSQPELIADGFRLYATGDGGYFLSDDNGMTWKDRSHLAPKAPFSFDYIWANESLVMASCLGENNKGLFRSDNKGQTWSFDPKMEGVTCIAESPAGIFASTWRGGSAAILKSTDKGLSWQLAGKGLENASQLWTIIAHGDELYAGGIGGVYASTDEGHSWEFRSKGMKPDEEIIRSLAFDTIHGTLYAGSPKGNLYVSSDQGLSWKVAAVFPTTSLATDNGSVYAFSGAGILYSDDAGTNWSYSTHAAMTEANAAFNSSIFVRGKTVIAGAAAGVFKSDDGAASWQFFSNGLPDDTPLTWLVSSLASDGEYLYAACRTEGIYRRSLSALTTTAASSQFNPSGVVSITPNPAADNTTVKFELPATNQQALLTLAGPTGQVFFTTKLDPDQQESQLAIATAELPNGIYTLRISHEKETFVRRLIVQH